MIIEMNDISAPMTWIKWAIGVAAVSILLSPIPIVYDILQERLTPRDYWFTYHSVEPTREVFKIGQPLTFYSVREIRHTAEFEWSDTLRCEMGGDGVGERTFSIYVAGKVLEPHSLESPGGIWTYNSEIPTEPATCYLISTTRAKLRYSDKVQTVYSKPFEIR